jgi:hypothetical protein
VDFNNNYCKKFPEPINIKFKIMKQIVFVVISFLVLSCKGDIKKEEGPKYDRNKFFVVDYESVLNNKAQINLSELTDDIEYVPLETNDNCLLHRMAEYFFTDDFIFVDNSTHILQFDRSGKFIKQIGTPGRGPGEIGLIRMLSVLDDKKQLVVQTNWAHKLYYFSYDGDFIKAAPFNGDEIWKIKAVPDNRLVYFNTCHSGQEDYMFALTNQAGDTLDVVCNHYKWEDSFHSGQSINYSSFVPFYFYNNTLSFKSMHNDTVYTVYGDSIRADYLVDLGDLQLPQEYRMETYKKIVRMNEFYEKVKGHRFCSVFEAKEMLFISSSDYKDYNTAYNMIYDRPTGSGRLLVDMHSDPGVIINDIDGGPDFWPLGTVNDSTVYMPVLPLDLKNKDFRDKLTKAEGVDPEKKNDLIKMIDGLSESDNSVLMIIRLKK